MLVNFKPEFLVDECVIDALSLVKELASRNRSSYSFPEVWAIFSAKRPFMSALADTRACHDRTTMEVRYLSCHLKMMVCIL